MKILIIHNHYGGHSGETSVMEKHQAILEKNGHQVRCYTRSSTEIKTMQFGAARAFFTALYNPRSIREVRRILHEYSPDIVHVHNLYPLISPSVLSCIKASGIPIVMTVHNYRLVCPNGLFFNKYGICERCAGGREWYCVRFNCEESLPKSLGYAIRNAWARVAQHYSYNIDAFLCLTGFQKNKLVNNGIPPHKCHILPNFAEIEPDEDHCPEAHHDCGGFLFIGRLNRQKGIDVIVESANLSPEASFRFAGSVDASFIDIRALPSNAQWLGAVDDEQRRLQLLKSRALVFASRSYEGFPMVFLEAMQHGLPVIAPRLAGYPEIVREGVNGWLFTPGDADGLAHIVRKIQGDPDQASMYGRNGREILLKEYSGEVWYREYMNIVSTLLKGKKMITRDAGGEV